MTTDSHEELGHRARKKLATREALSNAALRLALELGPENVRVNDIAAAAGVAPRTYNNYFATREEAICALRTAQAYRVEAALRARDEDEPLAEAIIHAMVEQYTGENEPDEVAMRMITSEPALRGEFIKGIIAIEEPLAKVIGERIGTDPEHDVTPRVIAAGVAGAARVATEHWLRPDTTASFPTLLREALSVALSMLESARS